MVPVLLCREGGRACEAKCTRLPEHYKSSVSMRRVHVVCRWRLTRLRIIPSRLSLPKLPGDLLDEDTEMENRSAIRGWLSWASCTAAATRSHRSTDRDFGTPSLDHITRRKAIPLALLWIGHCGKCFKNRSPERCIKAQLCEV